MDLSSCRRVGCSCGSDAIHHLSFISSRRFAAWSLRGSPPVLSFSFFPQGALRLEKVAEQGRALVGQHAFDYLHAMIQSLIFAKPIQRPHRAGFGVGAAVDEAG